MEVPAWLDTISVCFGSLLESMTLILHLIGVTWSNWQMWWVTYALPAIRWVCFLGTETSVEEFLKTLGCIDMHARHALARFFVDWILPQAEPLFYLHLPGRFEWGNWYVEHPVFLHRFLVLDGCVGFTLCFGSGSPWWVFPQNLFEHFWDLLGVLLFSKGRYQSWDLQRRSSAKDVPLMGWEQFLSDP